MEIICPECNRETAFNVTEAISCSHCKTSFQKLKLARKATITAWTALAVGAYAGHAIDDFLEPNRYPVSIEYALVESCTQGGKATGYNQRTDKKFAACTCALEKVQKTFDFQRYKAEFDEFSAAMREAAPSCL